MRRAVDALLLFAVLALGGWAYLDRAQLIDQVHRLVYGPPCAKPETYSLGTLDARFGLSQAQALALIESSAQAWNEVAHKTLLQYKRAGGDVTINFAYDRRQAVTQQLGSIGTDISSNTQTYRTLKAAYDAAAASLDAQKQALAAQQSAYAQHLATYNSEVDMWNARGGASDAARQKLDAERAQIQREAAQLQQSIDSYNASVAAVNALARQVNAAAADTNATVASYNTLGGSTGEEFTEGEYMQQGSHREIDIYQYSSAIKLKRVLEHEFGHSLGLGHVSDPQAIMYAVNTGTSLAPNAADLAELAKACAD
jgi:hypothetical protein